jgi:hypothetical protein
MKSNFRIKSNKGTDMADQRNKPASEHEEITARIASFKATQEKFEREREEYFDTPPENARKPSRPSFWS